LEVNIRRFTKNDATEVYNLLECAEEVHVGGLTYSEKAVQGWESIRSHDIILVGEVEGKIVGFVASKLNDPEPDSAYIDLIVVKPEYRGKGIGKKLLEQCILSLKKRGVFFVHLHVRTGFPRTVNFWKKNGFEKKEQLVWMCKEI